MQLRTRVNEGPDPFGARSCSRYGISICAEPQVLPGARYRASRGLSKKGGFKRPVVATRTGSQALKSA